MLVLVVGDAVEVVLFSQNPGHLETHCDSDDDDVPLREALNEVADAADLHDRVALLALVALLAVSGQVPEELDHALLGLAAQDVERVSGVVRSSRSALWHFGGIECV